jgi:16S rRNA (uracil1498-N3)-methyltransferase
MSARPWVFVNDVDVPVLDDNDRHHLERVVRVRLGDAVVISDGRGRWRDGVLGAGGVVEPTGDVQSSPLPAPPIRIAFALTKGERPELAVQKLTELGVDRIVPFVADRSVARWDGTRAESHVARLRRVAREASMQCRRPWLPVVDDVADFRAVCELPGAAMADLGGAPPSLDRPTVLVGPEGGWSEDERAGPLPTVALGAHVLRAETAAITAAALLGALRAAIVSPSR